MQIEIEIGAEVYIQADLDAKIETGNDSFDHEFGTEKYPDYYYIEEFEWDKSKHTDEENKHIKNYIDSNFEELESNYLNGHEPNGIDPI